MSIWSHIEAQPSRVPPLRPPGASALPGTDRPEPREEPEARTAPATQAEPHDLRLGRGVRLEGKLKFSGTVRVEATFRGEIVTDGVLVVGERAKVDAEISCGTVVVEGELNGNVTASSAVELRPTARLHGDVETPALSVDRGAIFEGASRLPRGSGGSDRPGGRTAAATAPSEG